MTKTKTENEIEVSATWMADDRRALDAIERVRADLSRARKLSPALVASLEGEIRVREDVLEKARAAGREYDRESFELARATARRQAALTRHSTSIEIDPTIAREI